MILEVVVTTCGSDGGVHIAPMGVRWRDGLAVLAPFRPSTTLDNINASGTAVINYTDDVRVFAGCVTGRREWPTVPAERVPGRRLAAALAHCEAVVSTMEDDAQRPRFLCRPVHKVTHAPFQGFNRAQGAVLEAAVLVSRLGMLPRDKVAREIEYLQIAVDKTAGPAEREAWQWLMAAVESHDANAAHDAAHGRS